MEDLEDTIRKNCASGQFVPPRMTIIYAFPPPQILREGKKIASHVERKKNQHDSISFLIRRLQLAQMELLFPRFNACANPSWIRFSDRQRGQEISLSFLRIQSIDLMMNLQVSHSASSAGNSAHGRTGQDNCAMSNFH